jgi:F0F1-type ATP synthase epsilon subunit
VASRLTVELRTPHAVVLSRALRSLRVPTETGLVGLRPRGEVMSLVVEPGLLVMRHDDGVAFAATAGGLLEADATHATLYTPFAVVGDEAGALLAALDRAVNAADSELAARRQLGELERRIAEEAGRSRRHGAGRGGGHGPAFTD